MLKWIDVNVDVVIQAIIFYGLKIIMALIILFVGWKLIKWLVNRLNNRFDNSRLDSSLKSFILTLVSILLKVALIISVIGMFGIEITSFIAILASFGFAIGLAFQGSLANFASGVLILILKPFKVGDFIEADKYNGVVKDIQIFYTILATSDNKKVVIPNSKLSDASVVNYSFYSTRRIELKIPCSYENDIFEVKDILYRLVSTHEKVLKEPEPTVIINEYEKSSLNFIIFGWVKREDYATVYNDLLFQVKKSFDKENIKI